METAASIVHVYAILILVAMVAVGVAGRGVFYAYDIYLQKTVIDFFLKSFFYLFCLKLRYLLEKKKLLQMMQKKSKIIIKK